MPDISKINALAIGSVAKVDGLAKASILDIDGVSVPAVPAPAAAYSVRLLGSAVGISSYTGDCMRVRRASDNVEADVGFDAGEFKLTSPISNTSDALSYTDFADFVDHTGTPTDAFVRYWYDQSGNSLDAGQSTAPNQPQIYDATTGLITENGKPAIDFLSATTTEFDTSVSLGQPATSFSVTGITASVVRFEGIYGNNLARGPHIRGALINEWGLYSGVGQQSSTGATGQQLVTALHDSSSYLWINGSVALNGVNAGTNTMTNINLGTYSSGSTTARWNHVIQEMIFWNNDQFGNRTGIESNINGFFSIYP